MEPNSLAFIMLKDGNFDLVRILRREELPSKRYMDLQICDYIYLVQVLSNNKKRFAMDDELFIATAKQIAKWRLNHI